MVTTRKLGIGLFGGNGHQIQYHLVDHPFARLVAVAQLPRERLPEPLRDDPTIAHYSSLDELLKDDRVELVSLCSPRRRDQADHAIACLEADRHVYAEKPAAMTEADLDRILAAARDADRRFHEMSPTAFEQPYLAVRRLIARGSIGQVVQVNAQKSYPLAIHRRPQDENIDGGLTMQVGIHALRMVEQVAGVRVSDAPGALSCFESTLGNPTDQGGLRTASTLIARLDNGGLATVVANYLNSPVFPRWGNEMLRIFGTQGFVEITDGGQHTRWMTLEKDRGAVEVQSPPIHYHDLIFASLMGVGEMPLTLDEELHPTRIVIRASEQAKQRA